MSLVFEQHTLLEVLNNDTEFLEILFEQGLLPRAAVTYDEQQAEAARLIYVLMRHLDVNWEGAEIIARLRAELLDTRRQISELLAHLKEHPKV